MASIYEKKAEALRKLESLARERQRQNPRLTYFQAYNQILEENGKLYRDVKEGCV
jgi:hypothetical protein